MSSCGHRGGGGGRHRRKEGLRDGEQEEGGYEHDREGTPGTSPHGLSMKGCMVVCEYHLSCLCPSQGISDQADAAVLAE